MLIQNALASTFVAHESSYPGGNYYRIGADGEEHFVLQDNFDPSEGHWMEKDFPEHQVLLYVGQTDRPDEIEKLLTARIHGATLLRRETL